MNPKSDAGGTYSVSLVDRNEVVEYRDSSGEYHFSVRKEGRRWLILLPGSRGAEYQGHELTPNEEGRIILRLEKYLCRIWWFGVFPRSYSVATAREEGWSIEEYHQQLERQGYLLERREDGSVLCTPPKLTIGARLRLLMQILRSILGA
jgi:hypothetical protein